MLVPCELVRCLLDDLLDFRLQQLVQLLYLIIALHDVLHVLLCNTPSYLMVLLRSLAELLPLHRVVCCGQIRRGLLGKHILDGKYFVEKLELLLGRLPVLL